MKNFTIVFLCLASLMMKAQTVNPTVVSSNGDYSQNTQGSIEWTLGEVVSDTYTSSANITTMGFHQPEAMGVASLIKEQGNLSEVLVYPNPVIDELTINLEGLEESNYKFELYDGIGKLVFSSSVLITNQNKLSKLNLAEFAAGNYYLKITSNNNFNKTVKINKIK